MKNFEDREKGFERKFARDEELRFAGDEAEAYARAVVDADFEKPGDSDVIEKVRNDLAAKGMEMSEAQLRTELTRAADEAKRQLSQG